MTKKQQLKMLTEWVKKLNPKAYLYPGDGRLGSVYAVATNNEDGGVHVWTSFKDLDTLESMLMMAFHIDEFMKIKEA